MSYLLLLDNVRPKVVRRSGRRVRVIQGWRLTDSALAIKLDAEQRTDQTAVTGPGSGYSCRD